MIKFLSRTQELILRNPRAGDEKEITAPRVIRKALDGGNIGYKTGTPRTLLNLDFEYMNRNKVNEVIEFLENSKNENVTYVDQNDRRHLGRVVTNPTEFTHVGRGNNTFRITFETR